MAHAQMTKIAKSKGRLQMQPALWLFVRSFRLETKNFPFGNTCYTVQTPEVVRP
jgi:hypothetical protein